MKYWVILAAAFCGQIGATMLWGWEGYYNYMWGVIALALICSLGDGGDFFGDSDAIMVLFTAGMLGVLSLGTWLLWPTIGEQLPNSGLWFTFKIIAWIYGPLLCLFALAAVPVVLRLLGMAALSTLVFGWFAVMEKHAEKKLVKYYND